MDQLMISASSMLAIIGRQVDPSNCFFKVPMHEILQKKQLMDQLLMISVLQLDNNPRQVGVMSNWFVQSPIREAEETVDGSF